MPDIPHQDTRCRQCGAHLGHSNAVLQTVSTYRSSKSLQRVRRPNFFSQRFGSFEMVCAQCGTRASTRGFVSIGHRRVNPLAKVLRGLRSFSRRAYPHSRIPETQGHKYPYEQTEAFSSLLAEAQFPVYGLGRKQSRLRLANFRWNEGDRKGTIERVTLTYLSGARKHPERVLHLRQSQGVDDVPIQYEAQVTIRGLMYAYGPKQLKDEYRYRGNIYRDWNLDGLAGKARAKTSLHIDGAPCIVEFQAWDEPLQLVLARFVIGDVGFFAGSLYMSHIQLLATLKTLRSLKGDRGSPVEVRI